MKQRLLLFLFMCLCTTLRAQWDEYAFPVSQPSFVYFFQIKFLSKTSVYATTNRKDYIYHSSDGGRSYSRILFPEGSFQDVCFIDDKHGIVASGDFDFYRTKDGYKTFNRIYIHNQEGDSAVINDHTFGIYFYDSLRGWFINKDTAGGCYQAWITSDGGAVWEKAGCGNMNLTINNTMFNPALERLIRVDGDVLMGRMGNVGIKVSDYGRKWEQYTVPWTSWQNEDFAFKDSLNGIYNTSDLGNTIARTHDGGKHWEYLSSLPISPRIVEYVKPSTSTSGYYLACSNGCYASYDDGTTWVKWDNLKHANVKFYDAETGISSSPNAEDRNAVRVFNPRKNVTAGDRSSSLLITPNPASDWVTLTFAESEYSTMELTDIAGRYICSFSFGHGVSQQDFSISTIQPGIYAVRVTGPSGNTLKAKLVISR